MRKGLLAGAILTTTAAVTLLGFTVVASASSSTNPPAPQKAALAPQTVGPLTTHESIYKPLNPCRIVDTRNVGNLTSGVGRNFVVSGTTLFVPQGGTAGGCGIPAAATAVTVSMSTTNVTGSGYLKAWPRGGAEPTATALLMSPGAGNFTGTTIPISSSGITVRPVGAGGRLVVDVTGYYEPQMYGVFNDNGTNRGTSRLFLYSHTIGTGLYVLETDTDVSACTISTSAWAQYHAEAYGSGDFIYVQTANTSNVAADIFFQVAATC